MNGGGTTTMGLGCVLISAHGWTSALDATHQLRRGISKDYGIRIRDEVKGEWIVGIKKHFRDAGLGDGQLRDIYRRHLQLAGAISPGIFSVVIEKTKINKPGLDVEDMAWRMLFQRLRLRTTQTGMPILLVHDQTSDYKGLRTRWRKFRRFSFDHTGKQVTAPLLLEDPISRDSSQSYFIQMADLVAYAATRRIVPAQGKRIARCSPEMWMEASQAHLTDVSTARWDAIVTWPRT